MWKVIKYRPIDVNLGGSTNYCYGLFRKEDHEVGRIVGPDTEMCKNGVHRFVINSAIFNTLGDFPEILMKPRDLFNILNEKITKLELPSFDQMKELIPEEFDLNNELTDEVMAELLPYSALRTLAIKQQIYIQSVNELLYGNDPVSDDDSSQTFVKPVSTEESTVTKQQKKQGLKSTSGSTTGSRPPGWIEYILTDAGEIGIRNTIRTGDFNKPEAVQSNPIWFDDTEIKPDFYTLGTDSNSVSADITTMSPDQ